MSASTEGVSTSPKVSTEEELGESSEVDGLDGIIALDSDKAVVRRLSTKLA